MPIAPSLITNLSLGGIGLVSAGGLAYGGYELLKDRPKPMSQILTAQKRVPLSQRAEEDEPLWKASWEKYVAKYNPQKPPAKPLAKGAPVPPPEPEAPIEDIWELGEKLKIKEVIPAEFKQKCKEEENHQVSGSWEERFKNYLEYCTKQSTEEE